MMTHEEWLHLLWAFLLGFWLRPVTQRLWMKLNKKCDEWANIE
jgi:hypothetical protein